MSGNTWETAAIIRLVDHLSGPLKTLEGSVKSSTTTLAGHMQRASSKMADMGRSMTFGMTLPLAELAHKMTENAVEFSKVENTLEGVLRNRARTMTNLTGTYEQYAAAQKKILSDDAKTAYERTGGLADILEYKKSQLEAIKSGHDAVAANAISTQGVYLGLAGRVSQSEATEDIIKLGMAFGVVTKNADGSSRSVAQLNKEFGKVADLLATMPTNAPMSYKEGVDSLKLSAPYAHLLKFEPGILGAMSEAMAENGIRGSEASVAQRSFMQSLLKPKSTAISTLEAAGVKYYDYVKFAPDFAMTPDAFAKYATRNGYSISKSTAALAFKKAQAGQMGSGGENDWLNDLGQNLTGSLLKKHTALNPEQVNQFVTRWMGAGVQNADVLGLVQAMRAAHGGAGLTAGEWGRIGEGRQFSRLSAFLNEKHDGAPDNFNQSMSRLFGEDWKEKKQRGELTPAYIGNVVRQADEHAKGLEGAIRRMKGSLTNLNSALYDAGVYDNVANGINGLAKTITALAKTDPAVLKGVATGLGALALLGPTAWVGGRLLSLALGISRFGAAVLGLGKIMKDVPGGGLPLVAPARGLKPGVSGAARGAGAVAEEVGAGALIGGAINRLALATTWSAPILLATTQKLNGDENERLRQEMTRRGKFMYQPAGRWLQPYADAPMWLDNQPSTGAFGLSGAKMAKPQGFGAIGPRSELPLMAHAQGQQVKIAPIEVHGQADVSVTSRLTVSPSPMFITTVMDAVMAKVKVNLGQTMAGSQAPAHVQDTMNGAAMP